VRASEREDGKNGGCGGKAGEKETLDGEGKGRLNRRRAAT
jgi:hypothetical protein